PTITRAVTERAASSSLAQPRARSGFPARRTSASFRRANARTRTIFPTGRASARVRVAAFALERARLAWRLLPAATAARAAPAASAPGGYRLALAAVAGLRPPAPQVSGLARWS